MVEVSIFKNGIKVSGHSDYAPRGHDIVCAAVSVLVQTLIRSIESLTEDRIKYNISPGRVDIGYKDLSGNSRTLIDSFFIGVCDIERRYGSQYVKVTSP